MGILRLTKSLICENCKYAKFGPLPQHILDKPGHAECSGCCLLTKRADNKIDFYIITGMEPCRFSKKELQSAIEQFEQRNIKKGTLTNE